MTTTVRASSWGSLFDCAYRWEGVHLLGIKSPSSPRAHLGTSIHAGTAAFDIARLQGGQPDAMEAGSTFLGALITPEYEVDWRESDLTKKEAEAIGLTLVSRYCHEISPRYDFVAVEMETTPLEINCGDGVTIRLTGTLDRARIKKGKSGVGIADVKTGVAAVSNGVAKTKPHKAQIGTYELLYEHTTGTPCTEDGEIIGLKTKGKPEVGTGSISGARTMMVGTDETPGLIQFAAEMFRSGLFYPNPQSQLCSKTYCPRWNTCHYKSE